MAVLSSTPNALNPVIRPENNNQRNTGRTAINIQLFSYSTPLNPSKKRIRLTINTATIVSTMALPLLGCRGNTVREIAESFDSSDSSGTLPRPSKFTLHSGNAASGHRQYGPYWRASQANCRCITTDALEASASPITDRATLARSPFVRRTMPDCPRI
jgi:hypothetical protein